MTGSFRLALVSDTYAPQLNGVTRTLDRLVTAVESRGGSVHVETVQDPAATPDPRVHRTRSIPFWAYPEMRISAPGAGAMAERIAAFRPHLMHATTPFGVGIAGLLAARALGLPIVSSYHTSYPQYLHHYGLTMLDAIAWPVLRWFHNSTLRTYVPSQWVASQLASHGVRGTRVWSRGVDTARFSPRHRSEAMRRRLGATDGSFLVIYVGRIAPEKGIDIAIDAMRLLADRAGGTMRFAFAGDGPAMARSRLRAAPGTTFTGPLAGEELAAFYASADAFVFPSTTDTFGNVVLEAMASGVPVIAPERGATAEIAHDGTALTFPGGDVPQLAARIEQLAADRALHARLQRAGLAVAAARTWDAVWDGLFDDYRAVAGAAATGRLAA